MHEVQAIRANSGEILSQFPSVSANVSVKWDLQAVWRGELPGKTVDYD